MRDALRDAAPWPGPVADVGAGTGLGTTVLAAACSAASVLAIEPSPVLRAVLLSRVAADPDLRHRVTVLAADALSAELPDQLGAVIAVNMIGHLPPEDRRKFWRRVAERLAPGAPLVVNLQPPGQVVTVPYSTFGSVRVGRHTYEGGGAAEPTGPDAVTWRMRYRIFDANGTVLHESSADHRWYVLSTSDLLAELTDAGLRGQVGTAHLVRAVRVG